MTTWGGGCASAEIRNRGQGFSATLETSVPRLDDMDIYQMIRLMFFLKERSAQDFSCQGLDILERMYWPHNGENFISSGDQPRLREILSWIQNHEITAGRPDLSSIVLIGRQGTQREHDRQETIRYWQAHDIHEISCLRYIRVPFQSLMDIDNRCIGGVPAYGSDFLEWSPQGNIIITDIQELREGRPIEINGCTIGRFRTYTPNRVRRLRSLLIQNGLLTGDLLRMPRRAFHECMRLREFSALRIRSPEIAPEELSPETVTEEELQQQGITRLLEAFARCAFIRAYGIDPVEEEYRWERLQLEREENRRRRTQFYLTLINDGREHVQELGRRLLAIEAE